MLAITASGAGDFAVWRCGIMSVCNWLCYGTFDKTGILQPICRVVLNKLKQGVAHLRKHWMDSKALAIALF